MSLSADLETLAAVGGDLTDAAVELDGAMTPPATDDVGEAASLIGDIMATFGSSVGTLVSAADGAGITVRDTASAYSETDGDASAWLHRSAGDLP